MPDYKVTYLVFLSACSVLFGTTSHGTDDKLRIMPLGDSLTEGLSSEKIDGKSNRFFTGGYRPHLEELLIETLGPDSFIFVGTRQLKSDKPRVLPMTQPKHQGLSGIQVDQIENGWRKQAPITGILEAERPDVILLMAGTNDILKKDSAEKALGEMEDLLRTIHVAMPETSIFLGTLPPMWTGHGKIRKAYNQGLATLVDRLKSEGFPVVLVPVGESVKASKTTLADAVHPADSEYKKMAESWHDALIKNHTFFANP